MKIYEARVKTEKELLADGWKTNGQDYYSPIVLDGHITGLMSLSLGKTIKLKYDGENAVGIKWYKQIGDQWHWREDMLTDICEFEEKKNISLTPLEIEKVRACIEYQVKYFEGIVNQEFDNEDATKIMEFYTQLANKFEV